MALQEALEAAEAMRAAATLGAGERDPMQAPILTLTLTLTLALALNPVG